MSNANSTTAADSPAPKDDVIPQEMGLEEMMRVMDVATALRHEQDLVEREFNVEKTKDLLREKLIKTAQLTGEDLTTDQVTAAVNWYYDNLHEYHEPKKSLTWYLAQLYIRRKRILQWAIPLVLVTAFTWMTWFAPFAPFSARNIKQRSVDAANIQVEQQIASIRSVSKSPAVLKTINQLESEAKTYYSNLETGQLQKVGDRLNEIDLRINEEFTITIVGGEKQRSGFPRNYEDEQGKRVSGYYLVVQARTADGTVLSRKIHNVETDKSKTVTSWAERVPKSVYDRLVEDKTSDGVLDETVFASKSRGRLSVEMIIADQNKLPIQRSAQITEW